MRSIVVVLLLMGVSSFAVAKPPSHAQACHTPAAAHNPHCQAPTTVISVPEPSTLGLMGLGITILLLARRRRRHD